jgi:hypothetical protein
MTTSFTTFCTGAEEQAQRDNIAQAKTVDIIFLTMIILAKMRQGQ